MTNGTINTSISTGATPYLAAHFGIPRDSTLLVIPMSLFLAGYGFSPVFWAPLSEAYGRRTVILPAFCIYTLFTMASGLATSWGMFLGFRFIVGFCAGCPFSVMTGVFADIYQGKRERGYAIMLINAVRSPRQEMRIGCMLMVIGDDFWTNYWADYFRVYGADIVEAAVLGGIGDCGGDAGTDILLLAWCVAAFVCDRLECDADPVAETFRALLLERKAKKMQKADPERKYVVLGRPHRTWQQTLSITLGRPLRMIFTEPLVIFSCLYLAFLNGVYYLSFESYPIIYQGKQSNGSVE